MTVGTSVDFVVARIVCSWVEVFWAAVEAAETCWVDSPRRRGGRLGLGHVRAEVVEVGLKARVRGRPGTGLEMGDDVLESREDALHPGGASPEQLVARAPRPRPGHRCRR